VASDTFARVRPAGKHRLSQRLAHKEKAVFPRGELRFFVGKKEVLYENRMGGTGFEVSPFSREKPDSPVEAAQNPAHFPADLAKLIQNWERLTSEDRRRITAIVEGRLA